MKIAPYYQKLLKETLQATRSFEPITYVGMFDSGVDYLFTLLVPLLAAESEKDTSLVAIDLSGLTTKEEVASEVGFALSEMDSVAPSPGDFAQLTRYVQNFAKRRRIVFVLYLGQEGQTENELFLFLNRLRNLLGWRFSYIIFTTTRLILHSDYVRPLIDKVLKRNLVAVQPLDKENSSAVLANYEERYSKVLLPSLRRKVLELAGGNPGLIKALYLQVSTSDKWKHPDVLDERIYFRLEGIVHDLPENIREAAKKHRLRKTDSATQPFYRFGYFIADKSSYRLFSPILDDFLNIYPTKGPRLKEPHALPNAELLNLTKSQRTLLAYLEGRSGELVTKDDIAQVLWGEAWADKYSDWAIDQLLSTLREKMSTMKHDGTIVTKKGEGIVFLPKKAQI